ncbi:MAG: hypothetical protein LBP68_06285 [Acidobacteriota bacterium]|jgi:thiosulfate/3-mercaptopyruvate sulfurtransferase|nr:hypothetical protein [Acidobacteriota bacterium]
MRTKKNLGFLGLLLFVLSILFSGTPAAMARSIEPVVSTDWLEQNLSRPDLTILDIRTPERYAKGHIPGAVNVPITVWAISAKELTLELPSDETLRESLGKAGITAARSVVVVNHTDSDFARSDAPRIAWTLLLAGVQNVAVLDGGSNKWERENKPSSTDVPQIQPVAYNGKISRASVASKDQVRNRSRKAILLDTRLPEDYFGITDPQGHIKGAKNLPIPWQYTRGGAFIPTETLRAMTEGVLGKDKSREIIAYCGVGGFAAAEWYILTEIFGYRNVKVYDGSWEEWTKDPAAPVEAYQWE